jgi:hypothetical protein
MDHAKTVIYVTACPVPLDKLAQVGADGQSLQMPCPAHFTPLCPTHCSTTAVIDPHLNAAHRALGLFNNGGMVVCTHDTSLGVMVH